MASYANERLDRLEQQLRRMEDRARRAEDKLAQLDQRQRMQAAGMAQTSGGGGGFSVGVALGSIPAGGGGYAQPCDSSAGWAYAGDPVAVLNPDPTAAIATGKRVGWMVDQSGNKIVSPLQC